MFGLQVTGNQQRAFETALATTEQTSIRVQPGDSLWSLAQEYPVDGLSSSDTSDLIAAWNSLDDAFLQPGMELLVPAA
ncbi:LysM peptidoglycan-binding domain-containing protein [Enorma phocaeensis]|uniref:LysM peptidoglycan-binding domain-containing protein n=1 Tax=Enorma phocaeensis TaxID=1871019 RepID=UPI0025A34F62|nr:LysM peptidoglycan-binding domain-containing protein [Enorma phocaeensis]